jgi:Putative peptidoglycan binding domain
VREALAARSGQDFVTTGGSSLRTGGRHVAAGLKAALLFVACRPAIVVGCGLLLAASVAVALNALAWQSIRHPSPMFPRKGEPERRVAVPPPLPPARPAEVRPAAPAPAPAAAPAATVTAPASPVPPPAPTRPAPARDPIGDLIRAGETGSAAAKDSTAKALAAQRALTKLGYGPIKSDGVIGPGTRQAIEKFERDRKLAVTGELNPRTARALAAQSGIAID